MNAIARPFQLVRSLQNPIFLQLYAAQTVNLLGDALTWVGLALLTFELGGAASAAVLSEALTLRVVAFVIFAPFAGAIADHSDRKRVLMLTQLARMLIVGLMPFVSEVWQIDGLIFGLNIFNAFFTPTYRATIPLVASKDDYPSAIALSSGTAQLLGIVGPGLAGGLAVMLGTRPLFFLDAASFLIAALLIGTLPNPLSVQPEDGSLSSFASRSWQDLTTGTVCFFSQPCLRYALGMQLVAAIAGAQILVNTIGYVKGTLHLSQAHYGWAMAMFGTGATLVAIAIGTLAPRLPSLRLLSLGAICLSLALLPAQAVGFLPLTLLWLVAGAGESAINIPTQTLIADRIPTELQGRVYGAHFAWSHLWWLFAYPLAGYLGSVSSVDLPAQFSPSPFLAGGLLSLAVWASVQLTLTPKPTPTGDSAADFL